MMSGRDAYRDELTKLAGVNEKIVCIEADLAGHTHPFKQKFAERFINVGIAEHTLVGMASGLSRCGFIPFISSFAPFAVFRAAEVVRLSMSYMGLNIKLVCPYSGVSGAWFGPTHHSLEDLGVIRSLPGIFVAAPHGEEETREVVRWASAHCGPVYIRLGRNSEFKSGKYLDALRYPFPRRGIIWNGHSKKCLIVTVGEMGTEFVLSLKNDLERIPHLHLPFLNREALKVASSTIKDFGNVVVVEECRSSTGIASELAVLNPSACVLSFSPDDTWPSYGGSHEDILEAMDFSKDRLRKLIFTTLDVTNMGGEI